MSAVAPAPATPLQFGFSTEDYSARDRIEAWREIFGKTILRVNFEPLRRDGFHADATAFKSAGMGVLFVNTSAVHQGNSRGLIASDDVSFGIGPASSWQVSSAGRSS